MTLSHQRNYAGRRSMRAAVLHPRRGVSSPARPTRQYLPDRQLPVALTQCGCGLGLEHHPTVRTWLAARRNIMRQIEPVNRISSNAPNQHSAGSWCPSAHITPAHASDALFLGHALSDFQAHMGLGDRALAAHLGCSPACLHRLALRACPTIGSPSYHADLKRIEDLIGADAVRLDQMLHTLAELHRCERAAPTA